MEQRPNRLFVEMICAQRVRFSALPGGHPPARRSAARMEVQWHESMGCHRRACHDRSFFE